MRLVLLCFCSVFTLACGAFGQLVREPNTTLTLPATAPVLTGYVTEDALAPLTFSNPIALRTPPGVTDRLFVVQRNGRIQLVDLQLMTKTLFLDVGLAAGGTIPTDNENGMLSMAFHPDYANNGYFYVFYSMMAETPARLFQRVARFRANGVPGSYHLATTADPASHMPMITQRDQRGSHNGGDMHFGADGYLYISLGDEGAGNDQWDNARFVNKDFFSAVMRLDVDMGPSSLAPNGHTQDSTAYPSAVHPGTYAIPADNPFIGITSYNGTAVDPTAVRTEFWATGFRNPWRFSFDPPTGRLFLGDVGQGAREEVNIVTAGANYGWSYREGEISGPRWASTPPGAVFVLPIHLYNHANTTMTGQCVTGGLVYRGTRLPELSEAYIFGDYLAGHLWALRQTEGTWVKQYLGIDKGIVAFGADPRNGDTLLCDMQAGLVKRLARSFASIPPATLSATGAFASLANLTPNPGIVPYDVNLPFWSDHAQKSRWFSIPNATDTIQFSADGHWQFPTGQVWIKHFEMEMERGVPSSLRRLETRFLVASGAGVYGLTYKWRTDGSDADLVEESGAEETLQITVNGELTPQVWRYPSRAECLTCHTAAGGFALSFQTRQLNRTHAYGGSVENQISALAGAGYFSEPVSAVGLSAHVAPADASQSLEHRVRSYLAVNCSSCHVPGAGVGIWDARGSVPTDAAGIIRGLLNDNSGDEANRVLAPGDIAHSMLLRRMRGDGVPRMPPLGSHLLDTEGLALIESWVMSGGIQRPSFADWQTSFFGGSESPDAHPDADPDKDGNNNAVEFLIGDTSPVEPGRPWQVEATSDAGGLRLEIFQPANRALLIETSVDLQTWSLWEAQGNTLTFPATDQVKVFEVPFEMSDRFFRGRLIAR